MEIEKRQISANEFFMFTGKTFVEVGLAKAESVNNEQLIKRGLWEPTMNDFVPYDDDPNTTKKEEKE